MGGGSFKGIVPVDFVNLHSFNIKIRTRYGVGNNFRNHQTFHKRNNKLINLCEIELFQIYLWDLSCF